MTKTVVFLFFCCSRILLHDLSTRFTCDNIYVKKYAKCTTRNMIFIHVLSILATGGSKSNRDIMNPNKIINKNLASLLQCINVKITILWERLIELGLFTSSDVEYIKVSTDSILLYDRD